MLVSRDISARADQMITSCGLDSLSIFFSAQSEGATSLTYLFHHGVSEEAQHAYKDGRVFEADPFPQVIDRTERCGRMIRWGDDQLGVETISPGSRKSWSVPAGAYNVKVEFEGGESLDSLETYDVRAGAEAVCEVFAR